MDWEAAILALVSGVCFGAVFAHTEWPRRRPWLTACAITLLAIFTLIAFPYGGGRPLLGLDFLVAGLLTYSFASTSLVRGIDSSGVSEMGFWDIVKMVTLQPKELRAMIAGD